MELNKIESIYFKTFFDLNIKILKNGEFYFNDIKYKNEDDFYSYLKETAGFYQDFILKELAGLNDDSKEFYLKAKIDKLKVHTDSLNFIKDTIEIKGKFNNLKTPYSTINVEFENQKKIEQTVLFDTIYFKIKVISLQILIAIGGHFRIINKGKEQSASLQNRIFINNESFAFFESLSKDVKNDLADYSFIFRKMHKDGFIFKGIKEKEFREFLIDYNGISLEKLKLLDYCQTVHKLNAYSSKKLLFKGLSIS